MNIQLLMQEKEISLTEFGEITKKGQPFWSGRVPVRGVPTADIGHQLAREIEELMDLPENQLDQDPRFLKLIRVWNEIID
jgi:hypothetical protein